jgi:signal transduction histidine kinase
LFALKRTADRLVFDAINPACEMSLGLSNADVVGRSPMEALPGAAGGPLLAGCLECAASAQLTRFTHPMVLGERQLCWETTLTPVCDDGGVVVVMLGYSRDIAGRLGRRRPGWEIDAEPATADHGAAPALRLGRDRRIVSISPEAASWMGVERKVYLGCDAREAPISRAMLGAVEAALTIGQPSKLTIGSPHRPSVYLQLDVEPTDSGADVFFRDGGREAGGDATAQSLDAMEYGVSAGSVEMALLDKSGAIVSVNSAWRETFAALQSDGRTFGVQTPYEDVCRRIIPDLDGRALHRAIRSLLAGKTHTLTHAYVVVTSAGPRWRQIRVTPLRAGVANFIAIHEDQTEVGQTQAALRHTSQQLLCAQQEERERITIELHDSTGERLAALSQGVSRLRRLMRDKARAQGILDDIAVSLEEATKEIRVMSYLMKAPTLQSDGLETAGRRYARGFVIRTGLKTIFRSEGPVDRASAAIQHAVFRVMQEALSNVYRHAHANGVEVELASRDDELTLRVADDGKGIPCLAQPHLEGVPPGVGIAGMRSRVEQLGGSLEIDSDRAGTVVSAKIPLADRPTGWPQRPIAIGGRGRPPILSYHKDTLFGVAAR